MRLISQVYLRIRSTDIITRDETKRRQILFIPSVHVIVTNYKERTSSRNKTTIVRGNKRNLVSG